MTGRNEHIRIDRLSYGNDAIGRLADGKTVFIEGGCPGDLATVEIIDERPTWSRAVIVEMDEPSPDRVETPCPYVSTCGGCPWQHISYEAQLRAKRTSVVDALTRIGSFDRDTIEGICSPISPSVRPWGYRNKMEFEVGHEDGFFLGMHAYGGALSRVDRCPLLPAPLVKTPGSLTGALRYLQGREDLGIVRVGVRHSDRTGDTEIALWTTTGQFPRSRVASVLGDALKSSSVVRVLLSGPERKRQVKGVEVLAGRGCWREKVDGSTLSFSAPSFFQVNTEGAEKLLEIAFEGLAPDVSMTVYDLYSGAGTFTIPLARRAGSVVAIESYGSSVRDLRRNIAESGLDAQVIGGDVARELPDLPRPDAAIIDPPRSGLSKEARQVLCEKNIPRLVYVSCDPATLARDLKIFCDGDYRMTSVCPVDLFPQTFHCETVVMLESRRK